MKVAGAQMYLSPHNIHFIAKDLKLTEMQSDSIEEIAKYKAKEAFAKLQKPLFVKDDGWYFSGLNGFPGPYMKYVNDWLTVGDFLNLLRDKTNREVIFCESIFYIDEKQMKIFTGKLMGRVLDSPSGIGKPSTQISSFRKDLKSMAECDNQGLPLSEKREVWNTFARWYKTISHSDKI